MLALNSPGHRPKGCMRDYGAPNPVNIAYSLNRETGQIERQRMVTNWMKGCPHVREGGNAVKWGWDCGDCPYA